MRVSPSRSSASAIQRITPSTIVSSKVASSMAVSLDICSNSCEVIRRG
jgi:hypothetical protein